jgi:hypothetical protein
VEVRVREKYTKQTKEKQYMQITINRLKSDPRLKPELQKTKISPKISRKHKGYAWVGGWIVRRRKPVSSRLKRWRRIVVPPLMGWYASNMANFVIGVRGMDADIIVELVPTSFNPSVWVHKRNGLNVLRVPKNFKKKTIEKLFRAGYWYSAYDNQWRPRKWRVKRNMHSKRLQAVLKQLFKYSQKTKGRDC